MRGTAGAIWGLTGVFLLLGSAIYRLTPLAIAAFAHTLFWYHWVSLSLVVLFMAFAEGYRGFQQRFSPRVAARARYLRAHPRALHVLLAPIASLIVSGIVLRPSITVGSKAEKVVVKGGG